MVSVMIFMYERNHPSLANRHVVSLFASTVNINNKNKIVLVSLKVLLLFDAFRMA